MNSPSFLDRIKGASLGFMVGRTRLKLRGASRVRRLSKTPLDEAITNAGSQAALARAIGVSQQLISYWIKKGGKVPAEYVPMVETAGNVSRHLLRPDVFGSPPSTAQPANAAA